MSLPRVCMLVAISAVCSFLLLETFLPGQTRSSLMNTQLFASSHQLHIDVPITQLAQTRIGDIVKGRMLTDQNGKRAYVNWMGTITADTAISPKQGCITVKVISDKYIAPGTPVSGTVGNAGFLGTVVGSPNNLQRIGNIERRLEALEPRSRGEVQALQRKVKRLKRQLDHLEGHKTVQERLLELEKRIVELEKRPPSENALAFSGNVAGMHFTGAIGPTDYPNLASRIDKIDSRIAALESRPKPSAAVKPIKEKVNELEDRLNELTNPEGVVTAKNEMADMERRLSELENEYGGGGGDNSHWYGTEQYHGLYSKPSRVPLRGREMDNYPGGVS
uniref:Uncharacterized protein n=2 Tax=Hanusia phi TaxID=3032 RepID=A0A7S0F1U0_9CRYP